MSIAIAVRSLRNHFRANNQHVGALKWAKLYTAMRKLVSNGIAKYAECKKCMITGNERFHCASKVCFGDVIRWECLQQDTEGIVKHYDHDYLSWQTARCSC